MINVILYIQLFVTTLYFVVSIPYLLRLEGVTQTYNLQADQALSPQTNTNSPEGERQKLWIIERKWQAVAIKLTIARMKAH